MKTSLKKLPPKRMSFDQSHDDNKTAFVHRLVTEAGWKRKEAEAEYDRIQKEGE